MLEASKCKRDEHRSVYRTGGTGPSSSFSAVAARFEIKAELCGGSSRGANVLSSYGDRRCPCEPHLAKHAVAAAACRPLPRRVGPGGSSPMRPGGGGAQGRHARSLGEAGDLGRRSSSRIPERTVFTASLCTKVAHWKAPSGSSVAQVLSLPSGSTVWTTNRVDANYARSTSGVDAVNAGDHLGSRRFGRSGSTSRLLTGKRGGIEVASTRPNFDFYDLRLRIYVSA